MLADQLQRAGGMSFVRDEVLNSLRPWRRAAVPGAISLVLFVFGWQALSRGSWIVVLAIGVLLSIALIALFVEIQHARIRRPVARPGAVFAEEGRIGFLGPHDGAFVNLADMTRIEIITNRLGPLDSDVFWILHHTAGEPLSIPSDSEGAADLFDALAPLPGIDWEEVIRALASPHDAQFLIWERSRDLKRYVD